MSRPTVQHGSQGKYVVEVQELLNKWVKKEDGKYAETLDPDGDFGNKTRDLVKRFQVNVFLYKDGKVGKMTWAALLGVEMYNCFDLPAPFVAAPNKYQCWAGATAMLLKRGAPVTTEPAGVNFEKLPGGATGGLDNSHENMRKFADYHDLAMLKAENLTCLQLCNLVDQFGRLMLNIKGVNSDMKKASSNDSHLLNLVGVRGDGQSNGTTVTLYNPSAIGYDGKIVTASYKYLKSLYPKLTYQVFYKYSNSSTPIYNPNVY